MKQTVAAVFVLATAATLLACGTSSEENPAGAAPTEGCAGVAEYFAGVEKVSSSGRSVSILDSMPAPPRAGENIWRIKLSQSDGAPIDNAAINVVPWMPKHQHGSPPPGVTALGQGEYELKPIIFIMPGVWDVTMDVSVNDQPAESIVFKFCIDG
jgi:hypothetical protein